jgi:CRISPR-associated exonuclease Cas4
VNSLREYSEEDYLQLSGIQHFDFCRRQWALIHIEQLWGENYLTADGRTMHERAHDRKSSEKRGDVLTIRALKVSSRELGLSGECDVVEFHASEEGVPLYGRRGRFVPYPVEYKRGNGSSESCDALQLCAQAMCLEEMLNCDIAQGALFYGAVRRRVEIEFSDELRGRVRAAAEEMHSLFQKRYTPKVKAGKACKRCSLADQCLPSLGNRRSAAEYIADKLKEAP